MKYLSPIAALLLAAPALANAAPAQAVGSQPCYISKLDDSSGMYVRLNSGLIYETYPGRDRVAASTWLPLDHIQVCLLGGVEYRLTNLSLLHPVSIRALNLIR